MQVYLAHIERFNPQVNALVNLQPSDGLLAQAEARDLDHGLYRGWMHGLPHAVKDLSLTQGIATTLGSPLYRDFIPERDGIMVERLKTAGAIIIGKSNTPEFGLGSQTYNTLFGATACAYDPSKTAGGSSGGAAAALALHLVPVADGSDMMGSLRNPAAFNNVFGFRPSQGRVPFDDNADLFIVQMGCRQACERLTLIGDMLSLPPSVAPAEGAMGDHIQFALKHEGINLTVLAQALRRIPANEVLAVWKAQWMQVRCS